jgi:hypothetical protein
MYYGYVQLFIFGQMLLWFNLYHSRFHLTRDHESMFFFLGFSAFLWVAQTGFSVAYFTTRILLQYILMVMATVKIFNNKYEFKKAVCLGFLLVFLNSFWWELFYHIYEFQIWLPYSLGLDWWVNRLPQWIRLTPVYFLRKNFKITELRYVEYGLVVNFALTYLRFHYPHLLGNYLHPVHRVIALSLLVLTIYNSEPKQRIDEDA